MKLNWGTSIAIFYITFAAAMVGMVIKSTSFDHSLVVDDYYAQDLNYQQQYNKLANAKALATDLTIGKVGNSVQLLFPKEIQVPSGEILFYRANDKSKDFKVAIAADSYGLQTIPTAQLTPGRWTVKVDWQGNGKDFYKEQVVIL